jgi:hypothetical protein
MLKMKVEPTMYMKTLAMGDNMSDFQTVFGAIMHGFCKNQREFCPFLQKDPRFSCRKTWELWTVQRRQSEILRCCSA